MNDEPDEEQGPYEFSEDPSPFEPSASEQTQFKIGEKRGRGRPRGAKGKRNIVARLLLENFDVREAGETKRLTALEIITKIARNHSLESDRAFAAVEDLIDRCTPQSRAPRHILVVLDEKLTQEMWDTKYGELGQDSAGA